MNPISPETFGWRELLAFYRDAGVDETLEELPVNRLLEKPPAARPGPFQEKPTGHSAAEKGVVDTQRFASASVPAEAQVERARQAAMAATSFQSLKEAVEGFDGCNLRFTAKNTVFADGNPEAPLMIIGDAPGRDDDLHGVPFSGPLGILTDAILQAINRDRTSAYLTTALPWRPPGARRATPSEADICRPFVLRHIELARPQILLLAGGEAARTVLGSNDAIHRIRGKWKVFQTSNGVEIAAMPVQSFDFLLKNPGHKRMAWGDLLQVKARLRS